MANYILQVKENQTELQQQIIKVFNRNTDRHTANVIVKEYWQLKRKGNAVEKF